jgi:uncharacterized lipoprotein YajG
MKKIAVVVLMIVLAGCSKQQNSGGTTPDPANQPSINHGGGQPSVPNSGGSQPRLNDIPN